MSGTWWCNWVPGRWNRGHEGEEGKSAVGVWPGSLSRSFCLVLGGVASIGWMATTRQLPAVRLPPTLGPSADIMISDKFTVLAAGDPKASPKRGTGAGPQPDAHHDPSFPWSTDDSADHASDTTPMNDPPAAPRLARAFSTPLPEQLGHLKHPHRSPSTAALPLSDARIREYNNISIELADSVQLAIQTLLQLVPPHLLDSAKEQYAACAVQVPTASVSALLTFMKNLNYMSANMSLLSASSEVAGTSTPSQHADFDVGELLQNVGDSLGGLAASAGVELVLFHADVGMKHISVHTDECGLSYSLTYVRPHSHHVYPHSPDPHSGRQAGSGSLQTRRHRRVGATNRHCWQPDSERVWFCHGPD